MATVVNNPAPESNGNSTLIVVVLLIVVFAVIFYVYGLPAFNSGQAPQINVPSKIDVNVQQEK